MGSLYMSQNQNGISSHFQAKTQAKFCSIESPPCLPDLIGSQLLGPQSAGMTAVMRAKSERERHAILALLQDIHIYWLSFFEE